MSKQALEIMNKALKLTDNADTKSIRNKRLTELLKAPDDDHTKEWYMCVPSCFNNALDIKLTPKKKDGKESLVWTQGSAFSFKAGDTIYNTPKAYSEWGEALKHFSLCVSVKHAIDATPKNKEKGNIVPRNPGLVHFSLLVPNSQQNAVVSRGDIQMTQDEFVLLLIKGPEGELKKKIP